MAHRLPTIVSMPKYVVIDGSNLAMSGAAGSPSQSSFSTLLQARRSVEALLTKDDVLRVFVDASFRHKISKGQDSDDFESLVSRGSIEVAPSRSEADLYILDWADKHDAIVISNDAFTKFQSEYPWLRGPGRLVGGMVDSVTGQWTYKERNYGTATARSLSDLMELANETAPEKPIINATGGYSRKLSIQNPTAVLFLLDQSQSMGRGWKSGKSRAQVAASLIDNTLRELLLNCTKEGEVESLLDVAIIGYRKKSPPIITSLIHGSQMEAPFVSISELRNNVLEVVTDEDGSQQPRWVRPTYGDETPMCAAFRAVETILADWISEHPHSFPPIVLNISDGESNDGNPMEPARSITSLRTTDGSVLLFNAFIAASEDSTQLVCPNDLGSNPDRVTKTMFEMSSVIPDALVESGQRRGFVIQKEARAYLQGTDMAEFASFLSFGSSSAFEIGNRHKVDPA